MYVVVNLSESRGYQYGLWVAVKQTGETCYVIVSWLESTRTYPPKQNRIRSSCLYMSQKVMGQDLYPVDSVIEKNYHKSELFSHCYIWACVLTSSDYLLII